MLPRPFASRNIQMAGSFINSLRRLRICSSFVMMVFASHSERRFSAGSVKGSIRKSASVLSLSTTGLISRIMMSKAGSS